MSRIESAAALREELDITDKLLNSQYELIDLIPPCPEHGSRCLPHAMEWVRERLAIMPARVAASILGGALGREPLLAQHWHVALATEIILEGAPADSANAAASRFMKAAFGVTTSCR